MMKITCWLVAMISLVSPFMLVGSENPPTRELLDMNTHWAFHEGDAK